MKEIDYNINLEVNQIGRRLSIGFCTSETLAAYVVIYKALGMDKEIALLCMRELAVRRKLGQDFDYESFIEQEVEKIPKMRGINLPEMGKKVMNNHGNLRSILGKNVS
jgi:hypothetical protein